jgi:4-oxalocrotonate tautomerase
MEKEKKAVLVRELTAKASEVTQIPAEKFIVLINEMERDNIGVGGKLLSEIL